MRGNYNIVVDTNELKSIKSTINTEYDELYEMVKTYQEMIDETEKIFDTNSAKRYRIIAHRYLDIVLLYLNNDFKEYVNKLDGIINDYNSFYNITGTIVGESDNDEV